MQSVVVAGPNLVGFFPDAGRGHEANKRDNNRNKQDIQAASDFAKRLNKTKNAGGLRGAIE